MSGFNLDDYVDVAERIRLFYERYPDGRLLTVEHGKYEVGGREFVYCKASAYRTADDIKPCAGIAWEPFPGATPYTRDSELMNAETAAWGRAIIAAGIPSKKIASAQEVRNRSEPVGDHSQDSREAAGSEGRRTKPENLARLYDLLISLTNTDRSIDWTASAGNTARREFGVSAFPDLEAGQLESLVAEVERWLAGKVPAEAPF